jgi:glycosyltransferase involved in cell wall biosynthesis
VDGLLISAESAEEVATAIERLARDPELARRLSAAGMRKVASQFSSERSAGVLARCVAATLLERAAS